MRTERAFIGIDVGTQGVRVIAMSGLGELLATHAYPFAEKPSEAMRLEQDPEEWWRSVLDGLRATVSDLRSRETGVDIHALTVTSTSGTVIPLDDQYRPLRPAIMYSDPRSRDDAHVCREAAARARAVGYTAFTSSSGLAKIVWFQREFPEWKDQVSRWVHAADFIVGRLSGVWDTTDETNALKTGYDLDRQKWPEYLEASLNIRLESLPKVVASGTPIGGVCRSVSEETGLPERTIVTSSVTDSCASQISSGAIRIGDWNTTIGTTMVLKGVTELPIEDPDGLIYNHKHPEGYWMPGGASNTGADWVAMDYAKHDLRVLNEAAALLTPSGHMAYPLKQRGERFPFSAPQAGGFEPEGLRPEESYTAKMEGTAFIERMAYDRITELSGRKPTCIYTAGGGSNSWTWLQIRCNVLGVPIVKMEHASAAAGAAMLAASKTHYRSLLEAGTEMLMPETVVEPGPLQLREQYGEMYAAFKQLLVEKGYLTL